MGRNNNNYQQSSRQSFSPAAVLLILDEIRDQFEETLKSEGSSLQFNSEKVFFAQKLIQSDYLCKLCGSNPEALKNAFLQVAATGLSLDPTQKLAWIIPQKGSPVYDISYRGMIRAAVDSNIISDAVVDLVFETDTFKSNGLRSSPTHEYDPFCSKGALIMNPSDTGQTGERGAFRGAYVDYRLPDGSTLVHFVTKDEIEALRMMSKSWSSVDERAKSPWSTFPWAMVRKSIVRSGNNILPIRSNKVDRLVHILDQNEGHEPLNGDVAAKMAGETPPNTRQGLMVKEDVPNQQSNQSTPDMGCTNQLSNGKQQAPLQNQSQAVQNINADPIPAEESANPEASDDLTPALKKRLERIAQRATVSKNFTAALEHVNESYKGAALELVLTLISKARHDYASGLIQRIADPEAYMEALEFVKTLPECTFKESFTTKLDKTITLLVQRLTEQAALGDDAAAIDYLEHLPEGDIKTKLSSALYELA